MSILGEVIAINFAIGVVTGITLGFEFGKIGRTYFIGDTFGAALAIEGITAFMTEATILFTFYG